jgi:Polycystin cation channel
VVDLPENNEQGARTILALLSETGWLDMQTRALFIEFSLYLPSNNLLLAARLVAEVHETGTVWMDYVLEPIDLVTYRTEVEPTTRRQLALYMIGLILVVLCLLWDLRSTWDLRWYQDRRTGAVRSPLFPKGH